MQLCDCLTQNVSNSEKVYQFVLCDLCHKYMQIMQVCHKSFTSVYSSLLHFVCTVTPLLLPIWLTLVNASIFSSFMYMYCDIEPNQVRSHEPIFIIKLVISPHCGLLCLLLAIDNKFSFFYLCIKFSSG